MHGVVQSAFLQALGYAIANSLWQMALIWLAFMLANSVFRFSAAAKYRLAVGAQLIGFTWFLVTLQFYYAQPSYTPSISAVGAGHQSITNDIVTRLITWLVRAEQVLPYLSIAYLLLMSFLSARWIIGYRSTQLIRHNGLRKMPVDWRLFVKKIAAQLGIKQDIKIFLSEQVTTPLTIGFLKPVILIPVAGINHLTTEQLEAVLLHELAHIKRYDYLLNMILSAVELALFFNPFTQLLSNTIQKERENSCDDWVLQFQYNAAEYAEALLRIAYLQQAPVFAMAATGKKNELLTRIKRVIGQKENHFNYRRQLLAFILVTGTLCSIAWLSPVSSNKDTIAASSLITNKRSTPLQKPLFLQEPVTKQQAGITKENPLFNPGFFLPEDVKSAIQKNMAVAGKDISEATEEIPGTVLSSIPDIVSGALTEAQKALVAEGIGFKKQADIIDNVRLQFEKKQSADSAYKFRKKHLSLEDEIAGSLKQAGVGIGKAGKEMEEMLPLTAETILNNENISIQIGNAVNEIKKLNLEKLVLDALRFADLGEEEKAELKELKSKPVPGKEKELLLKALKEKHQKRLHRQQPDQAVPAELIPPLPAPGLTAVVINNPDIPAVNSENEQAVQLIRVKLLVLQKLNKLLQTKIIPVVFRESPEISRAPVAITIAQ